MPTLNLNDPIQLCLLIALAAQIPVAVIATLTAFSQRKKLPTPARREPLQAARGVSHPAPITAERAGAPPERHPPAPEVAAPSQPEVAADLEPEVTPDAGAETAPLEQCRASVGRCCAAAGSRNHRRTARGSGT